MIRKKYKSTARAFLLLAGVFAIVMLIAIPGLGSSIISKITKTPKTCLEAPYDEKCYCPVGYRKVPVGWFGISRWTCEDLSALILDPESPNFEQEAIDFTINYLENYCYDICSEIECGNMDACILGNPPEGKDKCIEASYGYGDGRRMAYIRCNVVSERYPDGKPKESYTSWSMNFYVEGENGTPIIRKLLAPFNYCYNKETGKMCTLPYVCESRGNPDWCYPYLNVIVRE